MLSVIVPIYNEEKILKDNSDRFLGFSNNADLIFIDGGSSDGSIEIAKKYGRIFRSKKGRAIQMNRGGSEAQNDILLFLHADNFISSKSLANIENEVRRNSVVGGCLTQRIEREAFIFRAIEAQGNMRARISKIFYGDQGIFVKKDIFFQLGGFPQVPIMEDILFTKKLRKAGKTMVLADRIFVSARRWENAGIIKTALRYNIINIAFKLGTPLERIKILYEDIR